MVDLKLPTKLYNLLFQKQEFASDVISNLKDLLHILKNNNLFFFPEYTDHSIIHINGVLSSIERLITDETFDKLLPDDIGVLVTAVVLHDIGMLTNADMFKNIIEGKYDNIPENWFKDEPTWKELWKDYVKENQYWNTEKRENVTGDSNYVAKVTENDLNDETDEKTITYKISHPLKLEGEDRRFIGEFIRRHHARLAYEIALKGYIGKTTSNFKNERLPRNFMQLAGLIARSHGMNVRDTFDILEKKIGRASWKYPNNVKVILLMTLVRIADYLQIDSERTDQIMLDQRTMYSKYSFREHKTHLSITCIQKDDDDPEQIVVQAIPDDAQMFEKIERLIKDIQHEFDLSWAYLGEVYGNRYQLRYRRIITNISDDEVKKDYTFVPKQFCFKFNNSLLELLIAPLYGKDPSYGVRELVQNAVDACRTRMALDKEYNTNENFTHVTVSLDSNTHLFRIVDTGIGMNITEIEKFFLTIGSSYDSSIDWKKTRDDVNKEINKIYRTGRFGIGILAAFLLGSTITVKTKRYNSCQGYQFTLRLDKDFIQIDKVDLQADGTTIEIECNDMALMQLKKDVSDKSALYLGTNKWFGWYIDSKPKVEYIIDDIPIQLNSLGIEDYCPLPTSSSVKLQGYGDIRWKPIKSNEEKYITSIIEYPNSSELYCNGFLITTNSRKTKLSIAGLEKYIPCEFRIPNLMITDIHNQLRLNLQRDNIDENEKYAFEKDLAKAICKDYLCRLLAIDIYSFKYIRKFIFHKSGFIFNKYDAYPFELKNSADYNEKCLQGKTLIHVFYGRHGGMYRFNFHSWKPFMEKHPEAFFIFSNDDSDSLTTGKTDNIFNLIEKKARINELKHCSIVIHSEDLFTNIKVRSYGDYINEYDFDILNDTLVQLYRQSEPDDYIPIKEDPLNKKIVEELVSFFESLHNEESPLFFMIHHIEGKDITSSLDDFIDEYAGGDMIIPYDENERRQKFEKIYTECSDVIEQYQKIMQSQYFKKV